MKCEISSISHALWFALKNCIAHSDNYIVNINIRVGQRVQLHRVPHWVYTTLGSSDPVSSTSISSQSSLSIPILSTLNYSITIIRAAVHCITINWVGSTDESEQFKLVHITVFT